MRKASRSLAGAIVLAAVVAMPQLGQQSRLTVRVNAPGEVLAPPPRPKRRRLTQHDIDRIEHAERERTRKANARYWRWCYGEYGKPDCPF